MFDNFSTDGMEKSKDTLGGGGFIKPTAIYDAVVKAFYFIKSERGAIGCRLIATLADGSEFRHDIYVTDAEGKNYFLNKKDTTKKVPLPGYTLADDICLLTSQQPLNKQVWEEKVFNVYNKAEGKELPTTVKMATNVVGKGIKLGIQEVRKNKSAQDPVTKKWNPTNEETKENVIDKTFHAETNLTINEYREGKRQLSDSAFHDAWVKANTNADGTPKVRDSYKAVTGAPGAAQAGMPPAPGAAPAAAAAATDSLFS